MNSMPIPLILIVLGICLALYHLIFQLSAPVSLTRSLSKVAPMVLLLLAGLIGGLSLFLLLGLIACLAGDYFLSIEGNRNFLGGLSAFLIGHLFYIAHFSADFDQTNLLLPQSRETLLVLAALAAVVLLRLWPWLQELKIPVILYTFAIMAMAYFARMAQPGLLVLTGVVLFVISDVILANDKFTPLTRSFFRKLMPHAVWLLYFSGQSLIVAGSIFPFLIHAQTG